MTVVEGDLGSLQLLHCTLVPEEGGLSVVGSGDPSKQNAGLVVRLRRTICGPISLPETVPRLLLTDGIVDAATGAGPPGSAIDAAGSDLDVHEVTVLGACSGRTLRAGNSVFRDRVHVERRQVGCVRFSYVSLDSTVPRRYRCQPAEEATADRVFPQFASVTYGKPAYAQLAPACAPEITAGADDEGEMGAWHFLAQTLRGEALRAGLDEYLRVGLEAGTFFAT